MYIYMLVAKYGFAQSMDCAAQTMDPYFARAIHGLRSHSVRVHLNCARYVGMRCAIRARAWLV